jgi:hypothetical protein
MISGEPSPRELRRRLVARYDLTDPTLALIAEATLPALEANAALDERGVSAVNDAVEVLILSGLGTDSEISQVIGEYRESYGTRWREVLWRERLDRAAAAYAAGDHEGELIAPVALAALAPVPPIPPQPPEEIGDHGAGDTLAA